MPLYTLLFAAVFTGLQFLAQLLARGAGESPTPGSFELGAAALQSLLLLFHGWRASPSAATLCLAWALQGAMLGAAVDAVRWMRRGSSILFFFWDPRALIVLVGLWPLIFSAIKYSQRSAPAARVARATQAWVGGGFDDPKASSRQVSDAELKELKDVLRGPLGLMRVEPGLAMTRGPIPLLKTRPREVRFLGGEGISLETDGEAYALNGRGYFRVPVRLYDPQAKARLARIIAAPLP